MNTPRGYVTAVVAGAMTAGIGAASVLAVPPDKKVEAPAANVELAAYIKIPIIDIDTPGPLSIWRYLAIEAGTNPLLLGLIQEAGNSYNLPGLYTLFDSNTHIQALANGVAGEFVDFGLTSGGGGTGAWEVLGIVGGSSNVTDSRNIYFRPLLGGSQGLGAALYGTLSDADYTRNFSLLGSNLDITGDRTLGDFNSETAFTSGGYRSVLGANPDDSDPATLIAANPDATFNLGSLTGSAGGTGAIRGGGGLCLGSLSGCGGNISYATVGAPVTGQFTLGNTDIFAADFANNEVSVALKPGQFSVTGAVGGNFSIGGLQIGPENGFPINIQIPRTSSMLSSLTTSRQQSVRDSFMAVPGKSASDNATGGKHRPGPLRKAVADIKKAINEAVSGKQSDGESED